MAHIAQRSHIAVAIAAAAAVFSAGCGGGGGGGTSPTPTPTPTPVVVTLSAISPDHGGPGDTITISGTGFESLSRPLQVVVGAFPASSVAVVSDTQLTATVPIYNAAIEPLTVLVTVGNVHGKALYFTYTRVN